MDVDTATRVAPQFYKPFLPNLVTVFPALSSSGKSHLVKHILDHPSEYFSVLPSQVLVVLCNPRVEFQEGLKTVSLADFDPETDLEPETLLIFEDVQSLDDKITTCINVYCHHLNLVGIFVLVQGLLGRARVFPLVTLSHRVVLFLQSTAVSRLANYILQFYQDLELRDRVKSILAGAQRAEDIVLLEINKVRGQHQPYYLAIQGLDRYAMQGTPPFVFPHPNRTALYSATFDNNQVTLEDIPPEGSYVLVPASRVKKDLPAAEENHCQDEWKETLAVIRENLENNFEAKKLRLAENLVREIVRTDQFCVTADGRTLILKHHQTVRLPLLDLVAAIVRSSAPNETPNPKFVQFVKILLDNGAPLVYFKNKSLVQHASKRKQPTKKFYR